MKEVRDAVVKILEGTTLAQLCERARLLQIQPAQEVDFSI